MTTAITNQDTLLEKYSDNNELRALLQLIPFGIGSAIDSYAGNKANQLKYDRIKLLMQSFSEDLAKLEEASLNKEYIASDEFYLLFVKATGACEKEQNKEKIKFFKNLLVNAVTGINNDDDCSNLMADILKDLSYSECLILLELHTATNKSKSYKSFSSVDNVLAPYFLAQLGNKGLIENSSHNISLTDVASRLIEIISQHE